MKPGIGELWNISETVRVNVGNKVATYIVSGPGVVVDIHCNHDAYGDYYKVLWGKEVREFFALNFVEKLC